MSEIEAPDVRSGLRIDSGWELRVGANPDSEPGEPEWVPAEVPGDVHSVLIARGLAQDPFYADNLESMQWIEERPWAWRTTVDLPPGRAADERDVIRFGGLDLFATIRVNGQVVAQSSNMFLPLEVDITPLVAAGSSFELHVEFDPVSVGTDGREVPGQFSEFPGERVFVRKTQAQFGWDHAPRLVQTGIWRLVELRRVSAARLSPPRVQTTLGDAGVAVLSVSGVVGSPPGFAGRVHGTLRHGDEALTVAAVVSHGRYALSFSLADPELWWPNGQGPQALHRLELTLVDEAGKDSDRWAGLVGLRTVRLDTTPDPLEPGSSEFRFVVNGRPIFAMGASWVPAHLRHADNDAKRTAAQLESLAQAGGNMIRVWGGGEYESDTFYETCDRLGILVWQDFMFACGRYPDDDPQWLRSVEAEAAANVTRLRTHPCIALWCGSNENDWLEDWLVPGGITKDGYPGAKVVHAMLRETVRRLDPDTPWWPSSPIGGDDHNAQRAGDRHNWTTWHGLPMDRRTADGHVPPRSQPRHVSYWHLEDERARFLSEFGAHALPSEHTLRKYLPSPLGVDSPDLWRRDRNPVTRRVETLMRAHTGVPGDLVTYIAYSQWCQAEALRAGIETCRRQADDCGGVLFWVWNDAWPGITWSVIDVDLRPKSGYYMARRLWQPRVAILSENESTVSLTVVNDTGEPLADELRVDELDFAGHVHSTTCVDVELASRSAAVVLEFDAPHQADRTSRLLWVSGTDQRLAASRRLLADYRDLRRPAAQVEVRWARDGGDLTAEVSSDAVVLGVRLEHRSEVVYATDNCVDLRPGRTGLITFPGAAKLQTVDFDLSWM